MNYLGIKIGEMLNWKQQISDVAVTSNKENAILTKLRHFIDRKTLKSIYHEKFEPHLCHFSLLWAQNSNSVKRLFCFAKKARRINAHTSPLLRESNILKLPDKIALENCLLVDKCFNKFLPIIFKN